MSGKGGVLLTPARRPAGGSMADPPGNATEHRRGRSAPQGDVATVLDALGPRGPRGFKVLAKRWLSLRSSAVPR